MTVWEFVGDVGLICFSAAAGAAVISVVAGIAQEVRRVRWEQRAEALVSDWDAMLLERHMATCLGEHRTLSARLAEDEQVAALEEQFGLPSAPGSWYR